MYAVIGFGKQKVTVVAAVLDKVDYWSVVIQWFVFPLLIQ